MKVKPWNHQEKKDENIQLVEANQYDTKVHEEDWDGAMNQNFLKWENSKHCMATLLNLELYNSAMDPTRIPRQELEVNLFVSHYGRFDHYGSIRWEQAPLIRVSLQQKQMILAMLHTMSRTKLSIDIPKKSCLSSVFMNVFKRKRSCCQASVYYTAINYKLLSKQLFKHQQYEAYHRLSRLVYNYIPCPPRILKIRRSTQTISLDCFNHHHAQIPNQ